MIGAASVDEEVDFYRHFLAVRMDGLAEAGIQRAEAVNRLKELVVDSDDGQDGLLFGRLCQIAREGAAPGRKWTRQTLLAQLRGEVRLKVAPNYQRDINLLQAFSATGLAEVSEDIAGFCVERPTLENRIRDRLIEHRLVNLSGAGAGSWLLRSPERKLARQRSDNPGPTSD